VSFILKHFKVWLTRKGVCQFGSFSVSTVIADFGEFGNYSIDATFLQVDNDTLLWNTRPQVAPYGIGFTNPSNPAETFSHQPTGGSSNIYVICIIYKRPGMIYDAAIPPPGSDEMAYSELYQAATLVD